MGNAIECKTLTKRYGRKTALNAINLSLAEGRIVGILGPNGSGKTTLIKMLNGLLTPTSGELRIEGNLPGIETKSVVSYLPDKDYLGDEMSFTECTKLFADFYADFNKDKAFEMLRSLDIDPDMKFKFLSKGNREKAQLILVMSRAAKIYVLDEPIAGVDPAAREYILKTILNNINPGATVIIATHLISEIEKILDDVVFIKDGNIVLNDSAENIREKEGKSIDGLFREVFACSIN
ncbi:MAG: ABC transporter ATP-binding protein [Catonella sp.]|uniref:ABC transporter ATP-binding protein n=1 Tax=Catonella sp. TaxID=2382125 RepID=UPI003F9EC5C0